MAQRAEFPVQQRDCSWLCGMNHQILQPEVPMRDRHGIVLGNQRRQFGDQPLHFRNGLCFGAAILLGPAPDLPLEIIAGTPEIAETDAGGVHTMEPGHDIDEAFVDGLALIGRHSRKLGVAEDTPLEKIHDVEAGADDAGIFAQETDIGDRHVRRLERRHDAVFPLDLMGAGQQHASGLLAQDIAAAGLAIPQQEGGIGCAAGETRGHKIAGKAFEVGGKISAERLVVELLVVLAHRSARSPLAITIRKISDVPS